MISFKKKNKPGSSHPLQVEDPVNFKFLADFGTKIPSSRDMQALGRATCLDASTWPMKASQNRVPNIAH